MKHYSVLLEECIANLNLKKNGIYVDATLGYAGHSSHILKNISNGYLYAFEKDKEAICYSQDRLKEISPNYKIIHSDFAQMKLKLQECGVTKVDGILFDLGVSSPQIDEKSRGFSFMNDAPLDMRMNQNQEFSALNVVNDYEKEKLINIFYNYGEEPKSKIIASKIIEVREKRKIKTTKELVDIIAKAVGAKYFNLKHPERRIFQAIRIEVNNELKALETVLPEALSLLNVSGRICIITFHSLEDRIVKKIFKKYSEVDEFVKGLPEVPTKYQIKYKIINKKPIVATPKELEENTRSKSAKLRIIERISL